MVYSNGTRINFCTPHKEEQERISFLLRELGLNPMRDKKLVMVHCLPMVEFLKPCGKGARNKTIPDWCLQYSQENLKDLYEGLIKGDGSRNGNHTSYVTTSDKLRDKVIELALKLGYSVNFWFREGGERSIVRTN